MLLLTLLACLPYDGLDPSVPRVVEPRYVGCSVFAAIELQRPNGSWRAWYDRVQTYDTWGNLSHDRVDDAESTAFYEVMASYRGEWLDESTTVDQLDGNDSETYEQRNWDGIFLLQRFERIDQLVTRTTYADDGVHPYTSSEADIGDDGTIDAYATYGWNEAGLIAEAIVDEGGDGTQDRVRTLEYDAEGRVTLDDIQQRDAFQVTEYTWGGPHDNLLFYRSETGTVGGGSSVVEIDSIWDDGWATVTREYRRDGAIEEVATETFDGEGRLLTRLREFPQGGVNPAREEWSWACP
ncbi:MAG: hypothetical protein H6737_07610 [Alphaproteobacteria bacterium]|nr:hypothetical protein [Alphaproteobacteria bacterium]